jgi:alpha-glucosidase
MMVGEIYLPVERLVTYYGSEHSGVNLPFNFQLIESVWHARAIADAVNRYEGLLPAHGWPNWVLGNHDNPRIITRIGKDQARIAAMLLLTLRGTPTLYYGDEIGMHNVPIPPDCVQDPFEKNVPGLGHGRDPERTPMQWTAERNAGFTTGTPWLPLADDISTINVNAAREGTNSLLALYRRLIELRRREPSLAVGGYKSMPAEGDLLVYQRDATGGSPMLVALNFGASATKFSNDALSGKIVLSTCLNRENQIVDRTIELQPQEGIIIELRNRTT